jgi:hypothetical protein
VALARYADQAWATQLVDLGPERRIATLTAYTHVLAGSARDDVIDIFDVVFGDLQRAATHRGQKRRAGEFRASDQAALAEGAGELPRRPAPGSRQVCQASPVAR